MFSVLLATLFFVEAVVIEVLALIANAIFSKQVGVPADFHKTLRKRSESIKTLDETIYEVLQWTCSLSNLSYEQDSQIFW